MILSEIINIPNADNEVHARAFISAASGTGKKTLPKVDNKITILGRGVEAVVYRESGSPDVVKVLSTAHSDPIAQAYLSDLKNNPYIRYAYIATRYAKSNPYLPRISEITKQAVTLEKWTQLQQDAKLPADPYKYYAHPPVLVSFKMEKLIELNKLDRSQLEAVYRKMLGSTDYESDLEFHSDDYSELDVISEITDAIVRLVRGALKRATVPRGGDPMLYQAGKIVRSIVGQMHAAVDIHEGNIMVRATVGGPQIVITDPLVVNQNLL